MEMQKTKNSGKRLVLNYTALFAVIALLSFSFFLIFNKSLIHQNSDGVIQHYSSLVKLRHLLRDFIQAKGISWWSQDVALGGDTIGNLGMLTLSDPFSYLAALFPVKYMDISFSVAIILRLYFAGLALMGFIRYRGFSNGLCLLSAISYAFCAWAIGSMRHPFFLLPMILFPLVIWGIEKVFQKESPFLFIFSVALSLFSSIYFSYMTGVFALIYVFVRYFSEETSKGFKSFFSIFFKLFGCFIIACLLAAPFLILTVFALLKCNTTSVLGIDVFLTLKQFLLYIPSFVTKAEVFGNFSYTAVNALLVLLIPFAVMGLKNREKRVPSMMFLFSALMVAFPLWGSVMNGLSYSVGRWCYIYAFFCIWAGIEQWEAFRNMGKRERNVCAVWISVLFIAVVIAGVVFRILSSVGIALSFFEFFFMVLFLTKNKMRLQYVIILVSFNIGMSWCLRFSPFGYNGGSGIEEYAGIGECYERYENSVLRSAAGIKDKDFYRLDFAEHIGMNGNKYVLTTLPANESVYWNVNTISGYYSTIEDSVFKYHKQVLNSQNCERRVSVFGNDNRSRLNFLQGVKYYLYEKKNVNKEIETAKYAGYGFTDIKEKNQVKIKKSKYNVGLGYVFPKIISEEEYAKMEPLKCEQTMMQAVVLDQDTIKKNQLENLLVEESQLQYEDSSLAYEIGDNTSVEWEGTNAFRVTGDNDKIYLSVPKVKNAEIYVEFKNLKRIPYTTEELLQRQKDRGQKFSAYESRMRSISSLMRGKITDEFSAYIGVGNRQKYVAYLSQQAMGMAGLSDFMINIGYFDELNDQISMQFPVDGCYNFDDIKVYAVAQNNFDIQAEQLVNNRFTATTVKDDYIEGAINSVYDGWLYLNIVYNSGWRVYVDGEEKECTRTDTCFSGLPVTSGRHTVVLKYEPYGIKYYMIATLLGILSCAGVAIVRNYRKKKKTE